MIHVERFVNQLMNSNCYIVVEKESRLCICIDPGSEQSEREIAYINHNELTLDYIILTHEHTDHTWGVNALVNQYPKAKVICSEICEQNLKKEFQAYFLLYYDNPDYKYNVCKVDNTTEGLDGHLSWSGYELEFLSTPGHSMGSICIFLDNMLFTGDTIMLAKPYVNKRNGSKVFFHKSKQYIMESFSKETEVYPGHGDSFKLIDYISYNNANNTAFK